MGLVTKVVPGTELLDTAISLAQTIAGNAPLAVRATRKLAHLGLEMPLEAGTNEVWFAVSESFGGWGILGVIADRAGITLAL